MKKSNTLFSYFKKVPGNEKKQEDRTDTKQGAGNDDAPKKSATTPVKPAEDVDMNSSNSSKENTPASNNNNKKKAKVIAKEPKSKRRRIVAPSDSEEEPESMEEDVDDSEDEFKPNASDHSSSDGESDVLSDDLSASMSDSEPESPVKKSRKGTKRDRKGAPKAQPKGVQRTLSATPKTPKTPATKAFTPSVSNKTISKLASFSAPDTPGKASDMSDGRIFPYLSLDFLQPENIKDVEKNKFDHPDYSPMTLHVPESFLNQQTPAMRQWWVLKAQHYNTVLFFKMGKFYELFHMDATTAVKELGLIYMRGEQAHCGFPEIAFGRYADQLIQKGYKVARIEQTETPDGMTERCKTMSKRPTKFDKVVRREVCCVQTKALQRSSFINGKSNDSSSQYLMAICEQPDEKGVIYGVCILEATIGKFYLGQFSDDRHSSRLRTVFSHYPPAQILYPRGQLSEQTLTTMKNSTMAVIKDALRPEKEFWDGQKTLKFLAEGDYFMDEAKKEIEWPECIRKMLSDTDTLGLTPADNYSLAVSSLGAIVWYLVDALTDEELLTMKNFEEYVPIDSQGPPPELDKDKHAFDGKYMVLDGVTLKNLDVVINGSTGTQEGTLLESVDKCTTAFGKRLIKHWLCSPLCSPTEINSRLDAVEELMKDQEGSAEVTELLKKLPDLERALSRIHTMGSANRSKNHPEGRAVFFEDVIYSKRKIEDFLATLEGFKTAKKIVKRCEKCHFQSPLLRSVTSLIDDDGKFPDVSEELEYFDNAFDHQKAKTKGVINPASGVNEEYDTAIADMESLNKELDKYRMEQADLLGCKKVTYFGSAKNRFQLEIPESFVKKVPDSYELTSSKKGFKRFRTPEIEEMLASMMDAEDRRDAALKDTMRKVFNTFDKSYQKWMSGIQCLAVLDVLLSLATYSRCEEGVTCRPQFVLPSSSQQPFIELREARHPCYSKACVSGDFIPNDTVIGAKDDQDDSDDDNTTGKIVLVTGPNMGGKSTLMRQVGIVTIMAQLGCYVPAEKCVLTPVDRVFTRLGASDRIMAGESTFYVELSETSAILQHATPHSLVLMDELGRGTATYDGTAIASAVVNDLSSRVACRTLFSTHYHSLVESFSHDPNIRLGHMACMVEDDAEDPSMETITFLYKFVKGICPKSYGFNAARLAAIPDEIIKIAQRKAKEFEANINNLKSFMKLSQIESLKPACVQELINELSVNA